MWTQAALVLGLSLGLVGSIAYASIPAPSGLISGCLSTAQVQGQHALALLDTAQSAACQTGQTLINWNQTISPTQFGFEMIPGLSLQVTVPTNAVVYVSTMAPPPREAGGSVQRLKAMAPLVALDPGVNWSIGRVMNLAPGTHALSAAVVVREAPTAGLLVVSGAAADLQEGQLSAVILNR